MRGIFNPENGFWRVTGKIVDAALLSLFWIVCSLPVFTLGPATAALYKTSVKCLRGDETKSWSMFFLTFKENFKVGALTSLIVAAIAVALVYLHSLAYNAAAQDTFWTVFYYCYTFLLLLPLGAACYVFPVLSRFEMGVGALVTNSLKLAIAHLPSTIAMGAWLWLMQMLFLRWPVTFLFLPGLTAVFQSLLLERIFAPYMGSDADDPE